MIPAQFSYMSGNIKSRVKIDKIPITIAVLPNILASRFRATKPKIIPAPAKSNGIQKNEMTLSAIAIHP